jgi:hypothetical protein
VDEKKLEQWWDNFWRLIGTVLLDISSCRLIAGNQEMPFAFAITFENLSCKFIYKNVYSSINRLNFLK